jgi:hypothetical protein
LIFSFPRLGPGLQRQHHSALSVKPFLDASSTRGGTSAKTKNEKTRMKRADTWTSQANSLPTAAGNHYVEAGKP